MVVRVLERRNPAGENILSHVPGRRKRTPSPPNSPVKEKEN
jgi:hypothetical protein